MEGYEICMPEAWWILVISNKVLAIPYFVISIDAQIKKVVHIHAWLGHLFMYYCTMRLVLSLKLNEATRTRELHENTILIDSTW